jgi:hypothetical protein
MAREDSIQLLASGGIGLNVWDPAYADSMNDLVIPTKTLDYCAAGLPVIAQRTSLHEQMLGADYPLFVAGPTEVGPLVRKLLADPDFYAENAARCRAAAAPFTYESVCARIRPAIDASAGARARNS